MIAGKYFITPHAVKRFIERIVPEFDYNQALAEIIKSIQQCSEKPTLTEKYQAYYLRVNTLRKFIAVINSENVITTILCYKEKFDTKLKRWRRWKMSELYYLKLNYGLKTYEQMQKEMLGYHSVTAISNRAVKLQLSNKTNWSPIENIIALYYHPQKGFEILNKRRSKNSLKIKKCRLLKLLSN